ncbi:Rrf2 family transcriptional regulator [Marinihelvus fidelis]|uniref:Rrf2 family transcriptional regulator n=1 Tax=Marinihelvus fidelis TaxID=2613842 RepID=A0A5N0T7E3_9GAMM|nr:Rrf2 family transcriptional regulator [Marinihelvus fidelis]KAA9130812.1 Rrf2 family transcriptional regulator [Marinihelvus fidelis]
MRTAMQLTRFTDYSIKALVYLAEHPDEWVTIRQISEDYDISRNHLMKVASFLGTQGYLRSQRGPGGGIRLRVTPSDINLADVIMDAEGSMTLLDCMNETKAEIDAVQSRLRSVLVQAIQAFVDSLSVHTLEDLVSQGEGETAAAAPQ